MIRYKGITYPIKKHPKGLLHTVDDVTQIKSDMLSAILTRRGERVMDPLFGFNFGTINFNQPSEFTIGEMRQRIATVLKNQEKRVQVDDINITLLDEEILVQVFFLDPANLQEMQMLSIKVPYN